MRSDSIPVNRDAVLKVERLAVAAGHKRLLEGLSLQLKPGERVGLTGPSGCGKTTLLRCINALSKPADGAVMLDGRSPEELGWPEFRRRMVLVSQRPTLLDGTVWMNLERPFTYRGLRDGVTAQSFPADRAKDYLERMRLGARRMDQTAQSLSEGQQQRVCLIRALLLTPRVLLLDEPTSALDEESVEIVEDSVTRACRESNLACLIVSHDRRQVQRWCHRHIDLRDFEAVDRQRSATAERRDEAGEVSE